MALSADLTMWLCVCGILQLACLSIQVETRLTKEQPTNNHVISGQSHMKIYHNKHNGSFVGFTAFKQSTQFLESEDIVVFDGIIINEGGHYKEALNWFVCPTNGVYFIAVTFQRYADYGISVNVVKESVSILATNDPYYQNPWVIASNSGIVRCNEGQRIWVEDAGYSDGPYAVYGAPGIPHTTFSVVLMVEGDSEKALHSSFTGFSAWKSPIQNYSNGDTIVFDELNFNEGDHFLPSLNHFICAVDGIYFVTVNLRKQGSYALQLNVVKNNLPIMHSEDIWADNYYTTLTNSRLVRCLQGEFIAVKATGDGWMDGGSPRSTFSAMLLHEEGVATKHSSFIGFSAYKKMNQTYEAGQTITFDAVLINEGNAFEPILNRFLCPLDAVYYVSVTFKKFFTSPLQIDVQHETRVLLRSVETEPSNPWHTVSNSGLVRCFAGEEIKVIGVDSGSVYGDDNTAYTTFTVFMLYQY